MAGLNPNDIESIEVLRTPRRPVSRFARIERRDSHHHQKGAPQGPQIVFEGSGPMRVRPRSST
ncbi:MAG: hypothetical protein ACLRMJ_03135 [Alistipes finegoldii]